jgi:ATP-dependent Clp protease ATP-binding subunit ClpX
VIADATTLTEAGYVGEDVENIVLNLYQSANNNLERHQRASSTSTRSTSSPRRLHLVGLARRVGRGRAAGPAQDPRGHHGERPGQGQQAPAQPGPRPDRHHEHPVHLRRLVRGLDRIIEQRIGRRSVGFSREEKSGAAPKDPTDEGAILERRNLLRQTTTEDLEKFGLIPEFIGRLPVTAVLDPLTVDDLVHVMTEPKNALVKQYQKLLRYEKVKLRFTDAAVRALAEKAFHRRSGARGLRAIMEQVMLDVMYEVPSSDNLGEVVIGEDVVRGTQKPELKSA